VIQPCQLWPNHPLPHWLQTPLALILLTLNGAGIGFSLGVMFTHWWHYKIKLWLAPHSGEEGGK